MKKLLFLSAITILTLSLSAQMPQMGNNKNAQAIPNMGHIYGKVMDTSGNPLADVSVMLLQNKFDTVTKKRKDVLIGGLTTKANGEFSFNDLPIMGTLKLKISATGYKAIDQTVTFQMKPPPSGAAAKNDPMAGLAMLNAFDKDLGNIKLVTEAKQLEAVTVVSTKPGLKMDIDKKVFSVDKNLVSAGGTAVDVMKNVPSVQVDIDGNVKLRNATPQIFIEGRPTTLTLDQIPADAIESVEVITNPSAKYDASGGNAGILNIILKKNKKSGYNGNLRAGVDKRGGINAGGDFNLRQGKFNITASGMMNQMRTVSTGTTDRLNLLDTPMTHINQVNENKTKGGFMFGRLGLDFFATNRTTFSIAGIKVHGQFDPTETIAINTDTLYDAGATHSYSERNSTGTRTFNATGLQAGMKHLFPKEGEELTADLNMFSGKNTGGNIYTTDLFTTGGAKEGTQVQKLVNEGANRFLTVQTDYVKPLGKKTKLETGLRAQFRKFDNNNSNYYQDPATGDFVLIPSATGHYKNTENVYAAYVSVGSSIKDFGYKLGLRAESSDYNGELVSTSEKFSNTYPISLFPSIFLSQKLKNKQELQLSVTRRINRPNFFQLIPFIDYTDKLNITRGNPDLVPEFTSAFEGSYMKTFTGNNTFLATAYYRYTDNLITRYQVKETNPFTGDETLINTFINANSSRSFGSEFTSSNFIKKWLDFTTNLNVYNSKINTDDKSLAQEAMWSWFGKFNSNFKLPKKYTIQLSATYQSKTNLPVNSGGMGGGPFGQAMSSAQGYTKANYGVDIAFKKTFLKNDAASITLSINDIFGTRKFDQVSYSEYFVQNYNRLRDPQMFRINFSYRFGKMDASLFKRKNLKAQGEGMQGGMEGMQ